jgi:hypothetical protein
VNKPSIDLAFVACLSLVAWSCDSPTRPSPVAMSPPPSATPAPAVNFGLSGAVSSGGGPIAGARVAVLSEYRLVDSVVTDANGAYSLSRVGNLDPHAGALVSVSKAGFFTATKYIWVDKDRKADFDLERAVYIAVGQTIQSPIGVARCASLGYGGGEGAFCTRFVLTTPSAGTLDVVVGSNPPLPFDMCLLRPDGTIAAYNSANAGGRLSIAVPADATYQIDVVHIDSRTTGFQLTASLR